MTRPTIAEIRRAAAEIHGMSEAEIQSRSRERKYVDARQDAWTVAREAGYSYPQISAHWGVDHTTVRHVVTRRLPRPGAEITCRAISARAMDMALRRKAMERASAVRFAERQAR